MHYVFFVLILHFSTSLLANEKNGEVVKSAPAIPHPLNLESDWWSFFNVQPEELSGKIEIFKNDLDNFLSFSKKEEHQELIKIKQEIFLNLDLLNKKIRQITPKAPPALQMLKEYTPNQVLAVNQSFLQIQNEILELKDKIVLQKNRLIKLQSKLDKQILLYIQLPSASYEKLLLGLKIIALRVEIAIHKAEMDSLSEILTYRTRIKEILAEELKNAKEKVSYKGLDKQDLSKGYKKILQSLQNSQKNLDDLEKQLLLQNSEDLKCQLEYCFLSHKIITETIRIENINLELLINEIKQALCDLPFEEKSAPLEKTGESLANWEKTLSGVRQQCSSWQKQLENDHLQVSKMGAEGLKDKQDVLNDSEKIIASIHLEIDQSFGLIQDVKFNTSGAEQLIKLVQSRFVQEKSLSETWMIRAKNYWSHLIEQIDEKINFSLFHVKEHPVTILTLLKAIFTLIAAYLFSKYLRNVLSKKVFITKRFSKSTKYIVLRLIHYIVFILASLLALSFLGIDLTNIAIILGALGVGIGFGLQSMVNNIISGFTLLFNRYLKVGDIVEIQQNSLAVVSAINLQFTHICTFDGADQIIPNSQLFEGGLKNWTMQNNYRRLKMPFSVACGTDKEALRKVLLAAVRKEPYVLIGYSQFPDPQLWFVGYVEGVMNFELVAWVNLTMSAPHGAASSSLMWVIDDVLLKEGIAIPFPKRDLSIKEVSDK